MAPTGTGRYNDRGVTLLESAPPVVSLADRVGPDLWHSLIAGGERRSALPGEPVAGPGTDSTAAAIIDGSARLYLVISEGRQTTLRYYRRGELVGLLAHLGGWREWGAEAVVPTTYVAVTPERLRSLLDAEPDFLRAVMDEVAAIASDAIQMVVAAGSHTMAARVAGHLLEAAAPCADGRLVAQLTHQRLADTTGTAREVVTRMLRRFREAGAIATGPGVIEILDRDRLLTASAEIENSRLHPA